MRLKKVSLLAWLALWIVAGCAPTKAATGSQPITLTILAAASLTEPFQEIGQIFTTEHPGVKVVFNFGGSQQLAQQLAQGAPADVFASASQKTMDDSVAHNRVIRGTAQIFARNRLIVIFPAANPSGLKELKDLAKPGLKLDLADKSVPVGQYSLEFLDKASKDPGFGPTFKESVLKNVVSYEDNVKAILTKVTLNEVDAGIVYWSDISGDASGKTGKLEIPDMLNVIAEYPIGTIADSKNQPLAQAFMDLVLSPEGQKVLMSYHFVPVHP